jgi:undecaprenyl-diphosphatase
MNGMTYLQATLLGALQGVTEFLPISSSGHLVLLQHLFGLHEPAFIFDLFLHIATLVAVLAMYRQDVYALFAAWWGPRHGMPGNALERASARRLGLLLVLANVPTAVIGLLFESTFEQLFSAPWIVGLALLVTGTLLWLLRPSSGRQRGTSEVGMAHAILLGCIQGLAITPGISRSGSTIAIALLCGVSRESAARFSFLMAIPAILGAALLKSASVSTLSMAELNLVIAGMASALVVGYIALRYLIRLVMQGELWRFSFYCWAVGLTAIVFAR